MSRCFWFRLGCSLDQINIESFAYSAIPFLHNLQLLLARSQQSMARSELNTLQTMTGNIIKCMQRRTRPPHTTALSHARAYF